MALFNWFRGAHKPRGAASASLATGVRATSPGHAGPGDVAARLKSERARLRELLYNVVRESMVRVGVLSSSFKFKVLATDPRGRKFIVMMDLSPDFNSDVAQLTEIETLICHAAKARHDITVSAVYWRCDTTPRSARAGATPRAAASPVFPGHKGPDTPAAPQGTPAPAFDPVLSEEVSALRRALSAGIPLPGTPQQRATAATAGRLTGFENTEIIESRLPPLSVDDDAQAPADEEAHLPALSPTQYGDLQ